MSIYAYCLLRLPSEEPWPFMIGVGKHPVFAFRCGKYTMLLSRLDRHFPFTPRSIVEHGQVISRAFETHTVLPMRFGTFFSSEKQIGQLIRENQEELLAAFCRLRGKAEMRLKLILPCSDGEAQSIKKPPQRAWSLRDLSRGGTDFPLDPRNQELAELLAARARELFHPLEEQVCCRQIRGGELVVDCAHLIESQKVGSYQDLYQMAAERVNICAMRMSGPWPPYHFLPSSVRLPAAKATPVRPRVAVAAR